MHIPTKQLSAERAARQMRTDLEALHHPARPTTPCTAETARCANARSYYAALNACCRAHVIQLVGDVQEVFDALGVAWWADYGTLLGAVRNPLTTKRDYPWLPEGALPEGPIPAGIIPHDKDADVGALQRDWHKIERAVPTLRRRGYDVRVRLASMSLKVRLSPTNHTNVDVFTWYPRPDGSLTRRTYCQVDAFKGRELRPEQLFPLTTVPWEGLTLPAPATPAAFCAFRYGPTWATPLAANNDGAPR